MLVVNYTDAYGEIKEDEDGNQYREVIKRNNTIPMFIPDADIIRIQPYVSDAGVPFKNVSILKMRNDDLYKVVGNYKKIIDMYIRPTNKIGY